MRKSILLVASVALLGACNTPTTNEVKLSSFEDSASYSIGVSVGADLLENLDNDGMFETGINTDLVLAGIRKSFGLDSPKLSKSQADSIIPIYLDRLSKSRADKNLVGGNDFLEKNGAKEGVVTTESGLQYIVLKEGEGDSPKAADQVRVHYTGQLLNDKVFDSSVERNKPVVFYVRAVIPGWTEALQLMSPGAEYKLFIPADLAYGEKGGPKGSGIGPNEVLIFDVKLIDIISE